MTDSHIVIDLDARKEANAAKEVATSAAHGAALIGQKLDTHLANCERRYNQSDRRHEALVTDIKEGFGEQSKATQRIHGRIDRLLNAVIVGMATLIVLGAGVIGTMLWERVVG